MRTDKEISDELKVAQKRYNDLVEEAIKAGMKVELQVAMSRRNVWATVTREY